MSGEWGREDGSRDQVPGRHCIFVLDLATGVVVIPGLDPGIHAAFPHPKNSKGIFRPPRKGEVGCFLLPPPCGEVGERSDPGGGRFIRRYEKARII